jgi:hypothetical protein
VVFIPTFLFLKAHIMVQRERERERDKKSLWFHIKILNQRKFLVVMCILDRTYFNVIT